MTVIKPKQMKSYHSSALPMTAAATWRGFGVRGRADMAAMVMIPPTSPLRRRDYPLSCARDRAACLAWPEQWPLSQGGIEDSQIQSACPTWSRVADVLIYSQ